MMEWEYCKDWIAEDNVVGTGWWPMGKVIAPDGDGNGLCIVKLGRKYTIRYDQPVSRPLKPAIAGPFRSLKAAKAAYVLLYGDQL